MAAEDDPLQPASMTLMGGPIDTRRNPTVVNELAASRPLEWFERTVIHPVPLPNPGAFRPVYPGFVQDRKSVVSGKSVSVRVALGGRRIIKKKKKNGILLY